MQNDLAPKNQLPEVYNHKSLWVIRVTMAKIVNRYCQATVQCLAGMSQIDNMRFRLPTILPTSK